MKYVYKYRVDNNLIKKSNKHAAKGVMAIKKGSEEW